MGRQPLADRRRIERDAMRAHVNASSCGLAFASILRMRAGCRLRISRSSRSARRFAEREVVAMDEPLVALSAVELSGSFASSKPVRSDVAVLFISIASTKYSAFPHVRSCATAEVFRRELAGLTTDDIVARWWAGPVTREVEPTVGDSCSPCDLTRRAFSRILLRGEGGRIVALAGLVGAGRSESRVRSSASTLTTRAEVQIGGKGLRAPRHRRRCAPGSGSFRRTAVSRGSYVDVSISRNIALASLGRLQRFGFIFSASRAPFAADWAVRLRLETGGLGNPANSLSGGNVQKVVLAK